MMTSTAVELASVARSAKAGTPAAVNDETDSNRPVMSNPVSTRYRQWHVPRTVTVMPQPPESTSDPLCCELKHRLMLPSDPTKAIAFTHPPSATDCVTGPVACIAQLFVLAPRTPT